MSGRRLELTGIEPIEVWDLPVDGRPLHDWRDTPELADHLATLAIGLRAAPPTTLRPAALALARRFERVHVMGGAVDRSFADAIRARGLPCSFDADAFTPARVGARHHRGRCVDVGQSAIKIAEDDRCRRIARDPLRAPLRDEVAPTDRARARESTLAFLAESIRGASRVLLALPCEPTSDGLPSGCTYAWRDPDPDLVPSLEARTGAAIEWVNDAELAALAASRALPPGPSTLVLTLGFSVGAALLG